MVIDVASRLVDAMSCVFHLVSCRPILWHFYQSSGRSGASHPTHGSTSSSTVAVVVGHKGLAAATELAKHVGNPIGVLCVGRQGNTPLHRAAVGGNCAVVELLLKHGAAKEERNDLGRRPESCLPWSFKATLRCTMPPARAAT